MLTNDQIQNIRKEMLELSHNLFMDNTNRIKSFLATNQFQPSDMTPLIGYTIERADMVLILAGNDKLEDAEIIFRSMLESFMKFMHTLHKDETIVKQRIKEYWEIIGLHEKKRTSDMLKRMFASDMLIPDAFKTGVLTEEEEKVITNNPDYGDGRYRKILKESWSFTGLIKSIEIENKNNMFSSPTALSQHYSTASHIAHADEMGMNFIRATRFASPYDNDIRSLSQLLKLLNITTETIATLIINLYGINKDEHEFNIVNQNAQYYANKYWHYNVIVLNAIDESDDKKRSNF